MVITVSFHAGDLGKAGQAPRPIAKTADLDDDIDRGRDLRAGRARRDVDTAHADHLLDTRKRVSGGIRVNSRHRAIVPGVHGLQHIEGLSGAGPRR